MGAVGEISVPQVRCGISQEHLPGAEHQGMRGVRRTGNPHMNRHDSSDEAVRNDGR